MFKKKRVLVTGAYGFIGANLVRELLNKRAEVFTISRKDSQKWRLNDVLAQINDFDITLTDLSGLKRLGEKIKPEIIYHLASYGGHHFQNEEKKIIEINLTGTLNLLEALFNIPYQMFVNTGSSSEYGYKKKKMKECDLLEPVSFYAATKASATLLGQVYAKYYKKKIVTFRPFTVYGPYDNSNKFVPTVIRSCIKGETVKLTNGASNHDYIYSEDLIRAYLMAPFNKKISGEVINLGTGRQYENEEVISLVEKISGKKIAVVKGAYKKHSWDTSYWVADNRLAYKLMGWKPEYSFKKGLLKTYRWFENYYKNK